MKRRYAILFALSLTPLIGLSWMAARFGVSTRTFLDPSVVGLIVAAVFAGVGMHWNIRSKWPAKVALAAYALWMLEVLTSLAVVVDSATLVGAPYAVMVLGSLVAFIAQLAILLLPVPPLPAPPPVPEARIV